MSTAAKVIWTVIGIVLLVTVAVLLGGIVTMLLWNAGVVAIVAVCGGHIGHIGLGLAILLNLILFNLKPTPSVNRGEKA